MYFEIVQNPFKLVYEILVFDLIKDVQWHDIIANNLSISKGKIHKISLLNKVDGMSRWGELLNYGCPFTLLQNLST
jgi:hypothetical protein